jgi:hypothetical protein
MPGPALDHAVQGLVRTCYTAGDDLPALHQRLLHSLRRLVPFDASFVATADPDTLLFTLRRRHLGRGGAPVARQRVRGRTRREPVR